MENKNRIESLDYLRGIAALGIMTYHYYTWAYGKIDAEHFLGRVGFYGVSIFYILSGLTLFHVYFNKINGLAGIEDFYLKRFLRIYPLLIAVMIVTLILGLRPMPDYLTLFLNFTGLFGLFDWTNYIGAGVWSIGNELVFYLFFPILVFLGHKGKIAITAFSLLIFSIYLYFTFTAIDNSVSIFDQWHTYVNPLNQVFYFVSGFLVGYFLRNVTLTKTMGITLLIVALLAFAFIPADGNQISIVTGYNRILFTLTCLVICFAFYKVNFNLPKYISTPLNSLGEISYSLYLIHPIMWFFSGLFYRGVNKHLFTMDVSIRIAAGMGATFVVSYLSYRYFEKYFMRLGNRAQPLKL